MRSVTSAILDAISEATGQSYLVTTAGTFFDSRTRVRYISASLARRLGIRAADILGRSPCRLFRADSRSDRAAIDAAQNAGHRASLSIRVRGEQGDKADLAIRLEPIVDARGRTQSWLLTAASNAPPPARGDTHAGVIDPDAVRIHASRLSDGLEKISVGITLWDPDYRLVLYNRHYVEMYAAIADAIRPGVKAETLMHRAIERGLLAAPDGVERTIAARIGEFSTGSGFDQTLTDGRWIRYEDYPLACGGVLGLRTDISELKEKEHALQDRVAELQATQADLESQRTKLAELAEHLVHARDEAETANRAKSDFLANTSHELRSPLNAIIGFADLMRGQLFGPLAPQYLEYANDIHVSGTHLLSIINDILDLAKIEAGKIDLAEDVTEISRVVGAAIRLVVEAAERGRIAITTDLHPDLPMIWADERRLRQILLNLLTNAVKFTQPGGKVLVRARTDDSGGVVLEIADTGIGIRPEDMERALSAFGQVDGSLGRKFDGTGLGLPLTRQLTELHGGRFVIESEVGKGTIVRITLPVSRVVPKLAEISGG